MEFTVVIIVLAVIIFILLVSVLNMYNRLVRLRNNVKQSESGIDVYLNQRFDLIPNLVECVIAYTKHERETLEKITELRSMYAKNNKLDIKKASELNNSINHIMAVAENYPELNSSEQYLNLQKNLTKMESQLQAARRIYNNDVTKYNTKMETAPSNVIAKMFGFEKAELFQIEEYKKENIKIDFEG